MSRAYRITVKESETREIRGTDEICTQLELLEILPPESMAKLLADELKARGFEENEDGTLSRNDGKATVTVDPCNGEVSVRTNVEESVTIEAKKDATGWDDVGPGVDSVKDRTKRELKDIIEKKAGLETERLQGEATKALEQELENLQPELSSVVNKITREALKEKAKQLGAIKEIAEDAETGNLTIKIEV
ncbi:MAG: hypothetical protein ACRC8S_08430 [Fimbriiglobus sp.]